ncbi:phenylacetate-CoA oxygenase subunit PaaC [Planktomarina temperata]|jgi:ring-1,2-phenylacetyl-CoA epoxidase subunit PaaC|uniref:1,2-phenylacetyl-CoA epoxidase subunit PaaC n=1 Tax=uncultured Planktomarina sp. TaxID=1538529 RepID=UPI0023032A5A|nr:phenylacetate-CoA oxygenase subunit PaaC [Planktomarina temperata]MDA9268014.1 phenylacetate-CoA oxygenase subunit PaaC [bacterium]MDA7458956.1 phenylacetate-CoA oxygenase subunit PaaC [Planktomarina temperata]MDA7467570.1 phenylacetate-CoA oxygenase subunit PaaC [Planktomarina temperata]MDA7482224.1 phenylacetate-CoA oxygenase subunit PaaC [Planktomarina temperata]
MPAAWVAALIGLADDHLILGHRLSEWCGHAPMLEEDLAMPNIALDLIGQARGLYTYAGDLEGAGRDEDALAFGRMERAYRNLLICELPNGDFAQTMLRQFYFASFMQLFWQETESSTDATLAAIAAKAVKEAQYHRRHCAEWVIRLGDGTDESARRMAEAVTLLAPYTGEFFIADPEVGGAVEAGVLPDTKALQPAWQADIEQVFAAAKLVLPENVYAQKGGRSGLHTEAMGHLLAQLQFMQRSFPDMTW